MFFKTTTEPETEDEEGISEPPSKQIYLQLDTSEETIIKSSQDSVVLAQISEQLTALSSQVQVMRTEINASKESCQIAAATPATTASSASANDFHELDEKLLPVTHARSLTSILKYLDNWTLSEDGPKCVPCGIVVKYDHFSDGTDFDKDDIIPQSFSNMKKSIIRHLNCDSHIKSLKLFENAKAKEQELLDAGKKCGINCASAAYTCIYFAESKLSYEHHIADMYNSGGLVGSKNHSKNFPALFLPHLYDVLRSNVSNYVTANNLPFGLLADKMTTKHLTRHMVGIRVPIWDIRYPFLAKDIYVQCSCINDVSGKGIADHMIHTLESFGLDRIYQRDNLSGCAMDGQYIHLNINDHLHDTFFKDFHDVTWDPAHRIELSLKDTTGHNFIESTCDTIQCIMKYLSCGKPYMELLDHRLLSETFLTPKIFKSMKFVGHCMSVLKCFSSDFKSIVYTLATIDTEECLGLQEKILRLDFILDYLLMSDIMFHLTVCSKQVQRSSNLPWEFSKAIDSLIQTLNACLDSLTTCNVQSPSLLDSKLYPGFCNAYEIITKKEYQGCPLMDLPISTTTTRSKNTDFE